MQPWLTLLLYTRNRIYTDLKCRCSYFTQLWIISFFKTSFSLNKLLWFSIFFSSEGDEHQSRIGPMCRPICLWTPRTLEHCNAAVRTMMWNWTHNYRPIKVIHCSVFNTDQRLWQLHSSRRHRCMSTDCCSCQTHRTRSNLRLRSTARQPRWRTRQRKWLKCSTDTLFACDKRKSANSSYDTCNKCKIVEF